MSKFGDPMTEKEVRKAKAINYVALVILFTLLGLTFYAFLQLETKKRELEEKTQMLEDSTDNLRRIRIELETAQQQFAARSAGAVRALQTINDKLQSGDYDAARDMQGEIEEVVQNEQPTVPFVNFYSFDSPPAIRRKINAFLDQQALHVNVNQSLEKRHNWLAKVPTVYYYPEAAREAAHTLASSLESIAGKPFTVAPGYQDDYPKGAQGAWLNVHYPSEEAPKKQK